MIQRRYHGDVLHGDVAMRYQKSHDKQILFEDDDNTEQVTSELVDAITQSEKYVIPEPIKTKLGYHIILLCEKRDKVEKEKQLVPPKPKAAPAGTNIPT